MAWEIAFRLDASPPAIRAARKAVYGMAVGVGTSEVDARDIELAVGEALRTARSYAYHDKSGPLDLTVGFHGTHLTVIIRDHAAEAGTLLPIPRTLPDQREARGLYVVRKLMDEASLERITDGRPGTVFRMVKRVHWQPRPG